MVDIQDRLPAQELGVAPGFSIAETGVIIGLNREAGMWPARENKNTYKNYNTTGEAQ
jgi:hypothetical protein